MTGGFGADYTFEATGNVGVMRQAVEAARMGWGLCTVAGVAGKGETLDIVPRFLITGRRVAGSSFGGVKGRDQVPDLIAALDGGRDRRRALHLPPHRPRRGQPGLRADGGPGRDPQRDRVRLAGQRDDVRGPRVDAALEHLEVGAPQALEALAGDRLSQPAVHSQNGCQASATRCSRPARPQSSERLTTRSGAKKKAGAGPGSSPSPRLQLLPVRDPDRHAVGQLVAEMRVDRAPHAAVAGDVDVGGRAAFQRVDLLVGDGASVDAQALDELGVARRGEADQLDPLAPGEQEGGGDRRLARGAGDRPSARARSAPRRRAGRRSGTR